MSATRCTFALLTALVLVPTLPAAEIRGRIARLDLDKNELTIEPLLRRNPPMTLMIEKDTQVLFGQQAGTPADLAEGRRARVEYEMRDGRPVARMIRVVGAAPSRRSAAVPSGEGVVGILRRVALTDREIVVIGPGAKGPETETTLAVPEGTKILKDGKPIAFEDLKENETVLVQVEKRDGQMMAAQIQVGPVGAAAAPPQRQDAIPKIRRVLQLLDQVLGQMEKKREPRP
jgi:cold shock CspA family protein